MQKETQTIQNQVWQALMNSDFPSARQGLKRWEPKHPKEAREREHYLGKLLQYEGKWSEAKNVLMHARSQWGDHIGLRCDIVTSLYFQRDFFAWEESVRELVADYSNFSEKLNSKSRSRTEVFLGKNLEETGDIIGACGFYDAAQSIMTSDVIDRMLAVAQSLRLRCYFQPTDRLVKSYRHLIVFEETWGSQKLAFEILHALMHAEMALLGLEHGFIRLERILKLEHLSSEEKSLAYYDFLEGAIQRRWTSENMQILLKLRPENPEGVFELWLERVLGELKRGDILELNGIASQVGLNSYLRILLLVQRAVREPELALEIRNKYCLLVSALPEKSSSLWLRKLNDSTPQGNITIQLRKEAKELVYREKTISLKNRATSYAALSALGQKNIIPMELLAQEIWGAKQFNSSYYFRIHMLLSRLNKTISQRFGTHALVQIQGSEVKLSGGFTIESL